MQPDPESSPKSRVKSQSNFLLICSRKFYCTVGLTVLEWGFALLHRQAARGALTADGWGVPLSSLYI
jgi:hypothetical protein